MLHDSLHLGKGAMSMIVSLLFTGKGLLETKESLEPVPFMSPITQEATSSFHLLLVQSSNVGLTQERTGK